MGEYKISIIIPVYNRSNLLTDTIQSCLDQSFPVYEIIIVDDGSVENIYEVLGSFAENDQLKFQYFKFEKNKGAQYARNKGIELANGNFIQFLDSDDILHPGKFKHQIRIFNQFPHAEMVFGISQCFENETGDSSLIWSDYLQKDLLHAFLVNSPVWHTNSPLWKKEIIDKIGSWDITLHVWQDWEYHVRAICKGVKIIFQSEIVNFVRLAQPKQKNSQNYKKLNTNLTSRLIAGQVAEKHLRTNDLFKPKYRGALRHYYYELLLHSRNNESLYGKVLKEICKVEFRLLKKIALYILPFIFYLDISNKKDFSKRIIEYTLYKFGYRQVEKTWRKFKLETALITPNIITCN